MIITLDNIKKLQEEFSVIVKQKVTGNNNKPYYSLYNALDIQLSDENVIHIPKGFKWDLSSVPRLLWGLLPPDGDFELAALIHDYLYIYKADFNYTRKFADDEMLLWSKVISGTDNKVSIRNLDNQLRYIAVRLFGGIVYNKNR